MWRGPLELELLILNEKDRMPRLQEYMQTPEGRARLLDGMTHPAEYKILMGDPLACRSHARAMRQLLWTLEGVEVSDPSRMQQVLDALDVRALGVMTAWQHILEEDEL